MSGPKFRLGDPVRVINRESHHFDKVGRVTTIDKGDTEGYPFRVTGVSDEWPRWPLWYGPNELILAEQEQS
jgi:hypothetical protein